MSQKNDDKCGVQKKKQELQRTQRDIHWQKLNTFNKSMDISKTAISNVRKNLFLLVLHGIF